MPIFIAVLVLLLFTGGIDYETQATNRQDITDDAVIIETPSGGLARPVDNQPTGIVHGAATAKPAEEQMVEVVEAVEVPVVLPNPIVDTLSAQNIETNRALLRGEITLFDTKSAKAFFILSTNRQAIQSQSDSVDVVAAQSVSRTTKITRPAARLLPDTRYYYRLCYEDVAVVCGDVVSFETTERTRSTNYRPASATTNTATAINAYDATVRGSVRINDSADAISFFAYGEQRDLVAAIKTTYDEYADIKERGDLLQIDRVDVRLNADESYEEVIDDLERGTDYFYSLCVAYDDEKTGIACGSVRTFTTDARDRSNPVLQEIMETVSGDSVRFMATASMRDYRNGIVFLVYGVDEKAIDSVVTKNTFSAVRQNGDRLQKISLDTDLDGRDVYEVTQYDLQREAEYWYRACIQYETEDDRNRAVDRLVCSATKAFSTN